MPAMPIGEPTDSSQVGRSIPAWRDVPRMLRRFVYGSAVLMSACLIAVALCRWVLPYDYYPYNTPFLFWRYDFYDYRMFTDRFHYFHSTRFFTAHAEFNFSYPAPMALFYKLTYVVTHESTRGFLWIMSLTFIAVAIFFARALMRANVGWKPAATLTAASLLLSDPIWFELNRSNLEFYVWVVLTLGVWLFFRGNGYAAAACFGVAGAMKLFPFIYLGLLIAKKQYRQMLFGFAVSAAVMVGSLWLLCPDIGLAWQTLNRNANEFGRVYLYQRLWHEVGFDHSLFALIKMLWRHLPGPAVMSRVLTTYMAVAAIGGTVLFFGWIRKLPTVNQLLCLAVASVLLPPSSSDYTLIHLYAPWAAMLFAAFYAARARKIVPGLSAAFVCFTILLSPEKEIYFRSERAEGMIKAVTLLVLWYLAMKYPFDVAADVPAEHPAVEAQAT